MKVAYLSGLLCFVLLLSLAPTAEGRDAQRRDSVRQRVRAVLGPESLSSEESRYVDMDRGLVNESIFFQENHYRIGPGDLIRVSVFGQDDLSDTHLVSPDGSIMLPVFGRIPVEGLTQEDAAELIASKMSSMFIQPQVVVIIKEFRNNYCYALGRVNQPGKYHFNSRPTLLELITMAGGARAVGTQRNDPNLIGQMNYKQRYDKAVIIRGRDQLIEVDLDQLLRDGRMDLNLPLQPGDIVNIPESSERVTILGQVERPGMYSYEPGMTLLQLVSIAGNTKESANMKRVRVVRGDLSNQPEIFYRNLADALRGQRYDPLELKPGDLVYVPRKGVDKFLFTFSWINSAISTILTGDALVKLLEGR